MIPAVERRVYPVSKHAGVLRRRALASGLGCRPQIPKLKDHDNFFPRTVGLDRSYGIPGRTVWALKMLAAS